MENTQNKKTKILANKSDNVSMKALKNQPNYFDTLPDELYLEILKKVPQLELDSLALACHRFNRIIQDRRFWMKVVVEYHEVDLDNIVKLITTRPVQKLYLYALKIQSPSLLPALEATQPKWCLKEVCLERVQTCPQDLVRMFNICQQLTKVDLARIRVNNDVFVALLKNKNIEILRLRGLEGVEPDGLQIPLRNLRKLQECYIEGIFSIGAELFLSSICKNMSPSLLHLTFRHCFDSLTDHHIADIVSNCPLLRSVNVAYGVVLTASSTESLRTLKHLRVLEMAHCNHIPPAAFLPLTEMESLVELNIRDFRNREEFRSIEQLFGVTMLEDNFSSRVGTFKTRFGVVKKLTY